MLATVIPVFWLMVLQCLADKEPPGSPNWRAAYHAYLDHLVCLGHHIPSHWWTDPIPPSTWHWFTKPVSTTQERKVRRDCFRYRPREWPTMLDDYTIRAPDTGVGCMIGWCNPLRTGQEGHHKKGVHPDCYDSHFDQYPWEYEAPRPEDVAWVCQNCHRKLHAFDLRRRSAANDNTPQPAKRTAAAKVKQPPIKQRDLILKAKK